MNQSKAQTKLYLRERDSFLRDLESLMEKRIADFQDKVIQTQIDEQGWEHKGIRIPADEETVLVVFEPKNNPPEIRFGSRVLGEWRLDGSNSDFSDEINYWMPLPELPAGLR